MNYVILDMEWDSAYHKQHKRFVNQILQIGVDAVKYAKSLMPQVQYSTEDASRSDFEYLWKTVEAVMKAGATMINVPDTVGYAEPEQWGEMIAKLNDRMKNLDDSVLLSVHCHNDLGMATANTLAAIKNGADKVEVTMNGIGERAGNAAAAVVHTADFHLLLRHLLMEHLPQKVGSIYGMAVADDQEAQGFVVGVFLLHFVSSRSCPLADPKNIPLV